MMCSGKTCVGCAKIKVKCDKRLPRCGRCVRLGVECHVQARRRGRPKNSKVPVPSTPEKEEPSLPIVNTKPQGRQDTSPISAFEPFNSILRQMAQEGKVKGEALSKCVAITKFLGNVACCKGSKEAHDDFDYILKSLHGESLDPFEKRELQAKFDDAVKIPSYISSMNCDGSATLVQCFVNGSCMLLTNEDMAEKYMSATQINATYVDSGGDGNSVMDVFIGRQDRQSFGRAMIDLLLINPSLNCEFSLLVSCKQKSNLHGTVLSLCQTRLCVSADGSHVYVGTKLTPLPTQSPYLVNPSLRPDIIGNQSFSWVQTFTSNPPSMARSPNMFMSNGEATEFPAILLEDSDVVMKERENHSPMLVSDSYPQTRELLYHQEQQAGNAHPPDALAVPTEFDISELDLWGPSIFETGFEESTVVRSNRDEELSAIPVETVMSPSIHLEMQDSTTSTTRKRKAPYSNATTKETSCRQSNTELEEILEIFEPRESIAYV